jgi:hypothetical protein
MNVARMLAEAGLLDPSPNAPAMPKTVAEVPPTPPVALTLAAIADRINTFGRGAIDPTIPALEALTADERSVRYSLKALDETAMTGQTIRNPHFQGWYWIHSALSEAQQAAGSTVHAVDDADKALRWYIALLYLERARAVWSEHVGVPLAPSAA